MLVREWWSQGSGVAPEDMETWDGLLRVKGVGGWGPFCRHHTSWNHPGDTARGGHREKFGRWEGC